MRILRNGDNNDTSAKIGRQIQYTKRGTIRPVPARYTHKYDGGLVYETTSRRSRPGRGAPDVRAGSSVYRRVASMKNRRGETVPVVRPVRRPSVSPPHTHTHV